MNTETVNTEEQADSTPTWAEIHADKIELANKLHAAGISALVSSYGVHVGAHLGRQAREFVTREFPDTAIERTFLHGDMAEYEAFCNGVPLRWHQTVRVTVVDEE